MEEKSESAGDPFTTLCEALKDTFGARAGNVAVRQADAAADATQTALWLRIAETFRAA